MKRIKVCRLLGILLSKVGDWYATYLVYIQCYFLFVIDMLHSQKAKRRPPASIARSAAGSEKPQRSRSVSASNDRPRSRGRSPAFSAIAANFENKNTRNLSTPPPAVEKLIQKPGTSDSTQSTNSTSVGSNLMPRSVKGIHCLSLLVAYNLVVLTIESLN